MTKQDYMDMSGIIYRCDDCKHNDKKWYELPCDYCCPAHSGFEPKDKRAKGGEGADGGYNNKWFDVYTSW